MHDEHDSSDMGEEAPMKADEASVEEDKSMEDEAVTVAVSDHSEINETAVLGEQLAPVLANGRVDDSNDMLIRESLVNKELQLYESSICSIHDVKTVLKHTWNGVFTLKKIAFPTRFYLLAGNRNLTEEFLPRCEAPEGATACLKITQRLRLDPLKVEELEKKLYDSNYLSIPFYKKTNVDNCQFSVLLSLPLDRKAENGGGQEMVADVPLQQRSLHNLILYLNQKCAAGVIPLPDDENSTAMVHAFPPNCQFSNKLLRQLLPHLYQLSDSASSNDYLIIVLLKN